MRRIKDAKDRIREQLQTTLGDGSLNIEFTIKEKNRRILALEGEKRRLACLKCGIEGCPLLCAHVSWLSCLRLM